jgi:protein-arginine kinase activator protein McsA
MMGQTQRIASSYGYFNSYHLFLTDCAQCGEVFAIRQDLTEVRRRDGKEFYCPNGHTMVFSASKSFDERRIEELQRELAAAKDRAESAHRQREWAESRAKGCNIAAGKARAKAARLQHRVECGTCPNCHRTFKQLAAHMLAKHGIEGNAACGVGRDEQKRKAKR